MCIVEDCDIKEIHDINCHYPLRMERGSEINKGVIIEKNKKCRLKGCRIDIPHEKWVHDLNNPYFKLWVEDK